MLAAHCHFSGEHWFFLVSTLGSSPDMQASRASACTEEARLRGSVRCEGTSGGCQGKAVRSGRLQSTRPVRLAGWESAALQSAPGGGHGAARFSAVQSRGSQLQGCAEASCALPGGRRKQDVRSGWLQEAAQLWLAQPACATVQGARVGGYGMPHARIASLGGRLGAAQRRRHPTRARAGR
jgi:hypothetical protein